MADKLNAGKRVAINAVADYVIFVPMRVYHVFDRPISQFFEFGKHLAGEIAADIRINDDRVFIADDENIIRIKPQRCGFGSDERIDAFAQFFDVEIGPRRRSNVECGEQ